MTTTTTKRTPGPWTRSDRARWVVLSDAHPRKAVCVMRNMTDDAGEQEADANAELIAAAPETPGAGLAIVPLVHQQHARGPRPRGGEGIAPAAVAIAVGKPNGPNRRHPVPAQSREAQSHDRRYAIAVRTAGPPGGRVMWCLTVRQPWAWAIIHGPKRIENRGRRTNHRGPLLIHAGSSRAFLEGTTQGDWTNLPGLPAFDALDYGAVVGVVTVTGCVPVEEVAGRPFADGPWCWLLSDPRPFPVPIRLPGQPGLFRVPDAIMGPANGILS